MELVHLMSRLGRLFREQIEPPDKWELQASEEPDMHRVELRIWRGEGAARFSRLWLISLGVAEDELATIALCEFFIRDWHHELAKAHLITA